MLTSLRVEAVLLLALFVATGALTTSELPHGEAAGAGAWSNLVQLLDMLRR